jgi:hypothetical protein
MIEAFEQLTLEPPDLQKRPLPLPFLCAGCVGERPGDRSTLPGLRR